MTIKTTPYEFAHHVETDEDMMEYLTIILEENGVAGLTEALSYLAKKKGMTQTAKEAGLNRQSLYRTLSDKGNPNFDTVDKIIRALGFKLTIQHI